MNKNHLCSSFYRGLGWMYRKVAKTNCNVTSKSHIRFSIFAWAVSFLYIFLLYIDVFASHHN